MSGPIVPDPGITDPETRRRAELTARYLNWATRNTDWDEVLIVFNKVEVLGGSIRWEIDYEGAAVTAHHIVPEEGQMIHERLSQHMLDALLRNNAIYQRMQMGNPVGASTNPFAAHMPTYEDLLKAGVEDGGGDWLMQAARRGVRKP